MTALNATADRKVKANGKTLNADVKQNQQMKRTLFICLSVNRETLNCIKTVTMVMT